MSTLNLFKGINTKASANKMPEGYLRECVNFGIDNAGMLSKKDGTTKKDGGVYSALWSDGLRCFAVKSAHLIELSSTYGVTILKSDVGYYDMDFTECDGKYYFVSRVISGMIDGLTVQTTGQALVNYQPTLTASVGTMEAGVYLVAVTTLDANGMESGTKEPALITLTANQQINLSNIFVSSDSRVTDIAIYCSAQNGTELYRIATVANGVTTYIITAPNINKSLLGTIGINPAPFGNLINYHYGHLYIANDNYLFYSEPWRYERWQPKNHYRFPTKITAVLPCESGMWVSTVKDGLFWISGKSPNHGLNNLGDMTRFKKHSACLKKSSGQLVEAEYINQPSYGYLATANEGVFLLLDGGQFFNASQLHVTLPRLSGCTGALLKNADSFQYLAILKGAAVPTRTL